MLFVQRDDMVESLSAAASTQRSRSPVLPRRLQACALRLQASSLQKGNYIGIEFRFVVEDGMTIRTSLGKRFPQLLHQPISGRMTSDIEMQNPAPTMLDYEEAIQELECQRGQRTEVEDQDAPPDEPVS
jgi:hypothetical protein